MLNVIIVSANTTTGRHFVNALRVEADCIQIASVRNADDALIQLERLSCAVVVFLFFQNNAHFYRDLRLVASCPTASVMVVGVPEDSAVLLRCFAAGALNCALATEAIPDIVKKIHGTSEGKTHLSPDLAATLVVHLAALTQQLPLPLDFHQQFKNLSPREGAVLAFLEQKLSNRDIAEKLGIAEGTVKNHVSHILKKLGVENRHWAAELLRLSKG